MPAENLYLLVPETRPFAKKVKPEVQVEAIESAVRLGTATDLRLLQIYLKHLEDKKEESPVADAVAQHRDPGVRAGHPAGTVADAWARTTARSRQRPRSTSRPR